MKDIKITDKLGGIRITAADALVVAQKFASDPEGLAATGSNAPRDQAGLKRVLKKALEHGTQLWRVPIGNDLFGAIVGDDPFTQEETRLFIWLDPQHRGDDLGIQLVAETIHRLAQEGRERVVAKPPRSNYAALRILNALEFIYIGEDSDDSSEANKKVLFERGTRGGPSVPTPIQRDLAG